LALSILTPALGSRDFASVLNSMIVGSIVVSVDEAVETFNAELLPSISTVALIADKEELTTRSSAIGSEE